MSKGGKYTIHIGGEDRSGRFTMGFWELLQEDYGEPAGYLMSFVTELSFKELISLFYCSLKYDALARGNSFPYNRYQVAEWIDELQDEEDGEESIQEVVTTFLECKQVGKLMQAAEKVLEEINKAKEELTEEEIKKK